MKTPRTEAVHRHLRQRMDYTKTDAQVWREFAETLELEIHKLREAGSDLRGALRVARRILKCQGVQTDVGERQMAVWDDLTK